MSKQRDHKVLSLLGGIAILFATFILINWDEVKDGYEAGMKAACEDRCD
ncbi:hypothetical protein [Salegentibacter sp. F14]